jgi:putative DNA-invertase from lambdoid prophage Rac
MRLGRPKGSQNKEVKLTGKEEEDIKKLLDKKVAVAAIARILDVNRLTMRSFIKTRKIG